MIAAMTLKALESRVEELQAQNQEMKEHSQAASEGESRQISMVAGSAVVSGELESRLSELQEENTDLKKEEQQRWVDMQAIQTFMEEGYETIDWDLMQ